MEMTGMVMLTKRIGVFIFFLLLLLFSASAFTTSLPGRRLSRCMDTDKLANDQQVVDVSDNTLEGEEPSSSSSSVMNHEEESSSSGGDVNIIHERLLRANTKDYGRYDPAPALVRPPFKLIPN